MPFISRVFIKTSLIYLIIGFIIGSILLLNKALSLNPQIWNLLPIHIQILLWGWFIQFVFGVAFWALPKIGVSLEKVKSIKFSYLFINIGLLIRIISEVIIFFTQTENIFSIIGTSISYIGGLIFIFHIAPRIKEVKLHKEAMKD